MPWTAKWIVGIIGPVVLLVIADRLWYLYEMKELAHTLGVEWSRIERRGTFPFDHYQKTIHYGLTRDEVRQRMVGYSSVNEKRYGPYLYETYYYKFGALSRHGVRIEYDQWGRVRKVDDAPPVPPQDFSK
jgi:hypothetical protein